MRADRSSPKVRIGEGELTSIMVHTDAGASPGDLDLIEFADEQQAQIPLSRRREHGILQSLSNAGFVSGQAEDGALGLESAVTSPFTI